MANSVIGALRVNLGLDSAQFSNGLRRSKTGLAAFAAKAKLAAAAAASAFAVAGVALTKTGLKFIDDQAKMARSVDGTIDALRALQLAADDAGVGSKQVGQELQKMGRALADAKREGGPAAKALEHLGLNAENLLALDVDERVATISDRMAEMGLSASEATSLLADLNIRNKEMALLMIQGGDAIRNARNEVEDLGLSISEVDAAKIEEANDAMSRISAASEALANRFAVTFAPALEAIADAFVSAMKKGGALRETLDFLGDNISRIAAYAGGFAAFMAGKFAVAIGVAAVGAIRGLSLSFAGLRTAMLRTGLFALPVILGEAILWFTRVVERAGSFGAALGVLGDIASELGTRFKTVMVAIGNYIKGAMLLGASEVVSFSASLVESIGEGVDAAIEKIKSIPAAVRDALSGSAMGAILSGGRLGNEEILEKVEIPDLEIPKLDTAPTIEEAKQAGIESGKSMMQGLAWQMAVSGVLPKSEAEQLSAQIKSVITQTDLEAAGVAIMAGLQRGMESKIPAVAATAKRIALQAKTAIDEALQIKSPSRVAERQGKYFVEGFENGLSTFGGTAERFRTKAEAFAKSSAEAFAAGRAGMESAVAPFEALASLEKLVATETEKTNELLKETAEPVKETTQAVEKLTVAGGVGTAVVSSFGEALRGAGATGAASIEKVESSVEGVSNRMQSMKETFKSAFTGLISGAKSLKDTLKDLASQFLTMASNNLFEKIWGAFTGNVAGSVGTKGGFLSLLGFANGTPYAPGGLARVNERGGEIINLPTGSQVIPHEMSKKMMTGSAGVVEVVGGNLTLTDDGSIAAQVRIVGNEARNGAVSDVRQQFGSMQSTFSRDGILT